MVYLPAARVCHPSSPNQKDFGTSRWDGRREKQPRHKTGKTRIIIRKRKNRKRFRIYYVLRWPLRSARTTYHVYCIALRCSLLHFSANCCRWSADHHRPLPPPRMIPTNSGTKKKKKKTQNNNLANSNSTGSAVVPLLNQTHRPPLYRHHSLPPPPRTPATSTAKAVRVRARRLLAELVINSH